VAAREQAKNRIDRAIFIEDLLLIAPADAVVAIRMPPGRPGSLQKKLLPVVSDSIQASI
jgi:hypothetical protein